MFTYDPGFTSTASLQERDHLHRRGKRHPAPPRLSDRPAGGEFDLHGGRLPAPPRRASEQEGTRRVRLYDQPPHDGARAARDLLPRFPARCPSDGDPVRRRRRALLLLPRQHRHHRSRAADDRLAPADRENADARGDGLQIHARPAVHVSPEQPQLHRQLPADDLRRSRRAV